MQSFWRFFKLDAPYLMSGGAWTSLSFLVSALASLTTMVAFGNLLPRDTFGTYNYLLSLGASLSFLTLSGASPAVMRAVARGYESVIPAALRMQLKYNAGAMAIILMASLYYGYMGNSLFAISLAILVLAYPVAESFHIYKSVLTGRKRFDTLTKATSAVSLIGAVITVVTLILTDNILILIAIYTAMSLIPNIIIYRRVAGNVEESGPDNEQVKEMRRTSFHFTGAGIIGIIASYIDKIILFQVAGPVALAVYGFALAGPERFKSLIKNWGSIALPRLAQKSLGQVRQVIYKHIAFSLLVGISLTIIYWLIAPILFKLFLPLYLDSILYSQVMAISLITVPISVYIGSVFASQNMLRATYTLNFGNHIARIALFVVCGYLWQIWGLVAASIISSLINAIYGLAIWEVEARRLLKIQQHE